MCAFKRDTTAMVLYNTGNGCQTRAAAQLFSREKRFKYLVSNLQMDYLLIFLSVITATPSVISSDKLRNFFHFQ